MIFNAILNFSIPAAFAFLISIRVDGLASWWSNELHSDFVDILETSNAIPSHQNYRKIVAVEPLDAHRD